MCIVFVLDGIFRQENEQLKLLYLYEYALYLYLTENFGRKINTTQTQPQ